MPPTPIHLKARDVALAAKLTKAQRAVLQHVSDHSGRLYGSMWDFKGHRQDVVARVWYAGLIDPPRCTETHTWELTDAGRATLSKTEETSNG